MYLLLELQGFSFYILTAFNRNNQYSVESGLKYFILGSFSSIILLFGISILYGFSGLLSFSEIHLFLQHIDLYNINMSINIISISFIFIMISFLFKLYAAPFHLWVSDIYQGSPMMVTAFFSIIPSFSIFFIFSKLLLTIFYKLYIIYLPILVITIISSFLLGTFGALYQKKIKRLLAYSSITSIGYFLLLFISESPIMLYHIYSYMLLYSFSLLSIFTIFLQLYSKKQNLYIEQFTSLQGYININKYNAAILLFLFFSIAGIPPFSLFIGKLFLLTNLAFEKNFFFIFIILLITILSCYYYLRIIKIIFFNKNKNWLYINNLDFISSFFLIVFIVLQLFFFFQPSILTLLLKYCLFSL
jgi:NADH-quinone oxidoreductase subunit N